MEFRIVFRNNLAIIGNIGWLGVGKYTVANWFGSKSSWFLS